MFSFSFFLYVEIANCGRDIAFFSERLHKDTRQWLFEDFNTWFSNPDGDSRAYVLLGDAGVGKSVIAGALAQQMIKTRQLGAAYFCRHNDGTRNDPRNLLGTIACQLCDCNSEYSSRMGGEDGVKMFLANSNLGVQELCTKLLEEPLSKCSSFQRKLVVIDALDETEYKSRKDFICLIKERFPRLPECLVFFITSRPEDMLQSRLEKYNPCVRICAGNSEQRNFYQQHEQDIQRYLEKTVNFSGLPYSVKDVVEKCSGLFLYAFFVAKELNSALHSGNVDQVGDSFPGDIEDFFEKNLRRVYVKVGADLYRKLLGSIIAAPSPLPVSFISFILGRENSSLNEQKVIDAVSLFVGIQKTISFLHNLIPAWLTNKKKAQELYIDEKRAGEFLAEIVKEVLSAFVGDPGMKLKFIERDLQSCIVHFGIRLLCQHGEEDSLELVFRCLTSYHFLEGKIRSGRFGIYHLLKDFQYAASCLAVEEKEKQNILQETYSALESDVHVLVESPQLLRSCILNASDVVQANVLVPQVSSPWFEWNILEFSPGEILSRCNCFATASDKQTVVGADGRLLFFFSASMLQTVSEPFELSEDTISKITHLEFSSDDKFIFFGRLDKWFSVDGRCVEDRPQFAGNDIHYQWGLITTGDGRGVERGVEQFCNSFKSDFFMHFPEGFLNLLRNEFFRCISPGKNWLVNLSVNGRLELTRIKKKNPRKIKSTKDEHKITEMSHFTFTNDDGLVVYSSMKNSLHAVCLQTGKVFTSVSGCNFGLFKREKQRGYLFRSSGEERVVFLKNLCSPFKFFRFCAQKFDSMMFSSTMFSSSHTVTCISPASVVSLWNFKGHDDFMFFKIITSFPLSDSPGTLASPPKYVFSPDGKFIALQQKDKITLHCVEESQRYHCTVFEGNFGVVDACLQFSADSSLLFVCIQDSLKGPHFYVWDIRKEAMSHSFESPGLLLTLDCFCISSDMSYLILCGDYNEIEVCEFKNLKDSFSLLQSVGVEKFYNSVKFSLCIVSQDNELLVCCIANLIYVYKLTVANIYSSRKILRGHLGKIEFCRFLKGNLFLISYSVDGVVFLWNITESKAIGFAKIAHGEEKIVSMAVSPEEDRAVCFLSSGRVCEITLCKLECALSSKLLTALTEGKLDAPETKTQLAKHMPSTSNIPTSSLEDYKPEPLRNSDLEEDFYIPEDYFFESDESD